MAEYKLAELHVRSAREVWPHEALDFTPWLAAEENASRLSSALGLELEIEDTEVSVGPYSADILAKDPGTDKYVIIENQLEKTNHDHLGKAITYAAVLDASAVIWVASNFTEEHVKALSWLNDHTSSDVAFYGVKVELWQIGDSLPAVRFNVVSRPTEIVRQAAMAKASENLTETRKLQLEFWTAVRDELGSMNAAPSLQTPRPQYWYDVSLGRSGINLSNVADTIGNRIGVRVYLSNRVAERALPELEMQREEIEAEISSPLEWNPNPENRDKIIALYRDADLTNREQWTEYLDWITEKIILFRRAFSPRVKQLDLSRPAREEESDEEVAVEAD